MTTLRTRRRAETHASLDRLIAKYQPKAVVRSTSDYIKLDRRGRK